MPGPQTTGRFQPAEAPEGEPKKSNKTLIVVGVLAVVVLLGVGALIVAIALGWGLGLFSS
jgi:uncharacterized protein involved in exopolysaccharide biosynthesis